VNEAFRAAIAASLSEALGERCELRALQPAGGGCIHRAWCAVDQRGRRWFVKANRASDDCLFAREFEALREIAATRTVRVPQAVAHGSDAELDRAWLVCEWLELRPLDELSGARLGERLAEMHRRLSGQGFGWHRDNAIGRTPQPNGWLPDWLRFWRERRLGFQLALARKDGANARLLALGERLMEALPMLLAEHQPAPSLLHGDLWGGNAAATADGEPVIFDPATYYGDREADLAMTELFGGFPQSFFEAYRRAWPLDRGYALRKTLYNLYHVLNHAHLFGGGYYAQAEAMMQRLLAEVSG